MTTVERIEYAAAALAILAAVLVVIYAMDHWASRKAISRAAAVEAAWPIGDPTGTTPQPAPMGGRWDDQGRYIEPREW